MSIGNTNRYAYDLQQTKLAIPSLKLKGKSTHQERSYGLIHCSLWSSRSECAAKLTNATFYLWRCVSKRNVRPLRPKKSLKENCFLPKGNARFLAACAPSFRMSSPIVNSFTLQRLLSFAFLTANGTLPQNLFPWFCLENSLQKKSFQRFLFMISECAILSLPDSNYFSYQTNDLDLRHSF